MRTVLNFDLSFDYNRKQANFKIICALRIRFISGLFYNHGLDERKKNIFRCC